MIHRLSKPRRYKRRIPELDRRDESPKRVPLIDQVSSPRLKELLRQPVGTPVELTPEEAWEIIEAGAGGRPDLPSGKEYVRRVSHIWGAFRPRD